MQNERNLKFMNPTPTREQAAKMAEMERKEVLARVYAEFGVEKFEKEFGKIGGKNAGRQ